LRLKITDKNINWSMLKGSSRKDKAITSVIWAKARFRLPGFISQNVGARPLTRFLLSEISQRLFLSFNYNAIRNGGEIAKKL